MDGMSCLLSLLSLSLGPCARGETETEREEWATNRHAIPKERDIGGPSLSLSVSLPPPRARKQKGKDEGIDSGSEDESEWISYENRLISQPHWILLILLPVLSLLISRAREREGTRERGQGTEGNDRKVVAARRLFPFLIARARRDKDKRDICQTDRQ